MRFFTLWYKQSDHLKNKIKEDIIQNWLLIKNKVVTLVLKCICGHFPLVEIYFKNTYTTPLNHSSGPVDLDLCIFVTKKRQFALFEHILLGLNSYRLSKTKFRFPEQATHHLNQKGVFHYIPPCSKSGCKALNLWAFDIKTHAPMYRHFRPTNWNQKIYIDLHEFSSCPTWGKVTIKIQNIHY